MARTAFGRWVRDRLRRALGVSDLAARAEAAERATAELSAGVNALAAGLTGLPGGVEAVGGKLNAVAGLVDAAAAKLDDLTTAATKLDGLAAVATKLDAVAGSVGATAAKLDGLAAAVAALPTPAEIAALREAVGLLAGQGQLRTTEEADRTRAMLSEQADQTRLRETEEADRTRAAVNEQADQTRRRVTEEADTSRGRIETEVGRVIHLLNRLTEGVIDAPRKAAELDELLPLFRAVGAWRRQASGVERVSVGIRTAHPVAASSPDHLMPWGTMRDNSVNRAFDRKVIDWLGLDGLSVLDLGCSGGGFVKGMHDLGCLAVGVEGSDYSRLRGRAEWATIPHRLFTADVGRPFTLHADGDDAPLRFRLVTSWEMLEHIAPDDLPAVWENVARHLAPGGVFVGSVSPNDDVVNGVQLHQTVRPAEWWFELVARCGFTHHPAALPYFGQDMVRNEANAPRSFFLVLTRTGDPLPHPDRVVAAAPPSAAADFSPPAPRRPVPEEAGERADALRAAAASGIPVYLGDDLLPSAAPARGPIPHPVVVVSLPKAGTYLIGELVRRLGAVPTGLHLASGALSDYRFATRREMREEFPRFTRAVPLAHSVPLVRPGQYAVGHLEYLHDVRTVLWNTKVLFATRDLRHALVSWCRWLDSTRREPRWNYLFERTSDAKEQMAGFMAVVGPTCRETFAAVAGWKDDERALRVRFETLFGDDGADAQLALVRGIAAFVECPLPPDALPPLLDGLFDQETKTSSGSRSTLAGYWSEAAEAEFRRLGLHELNAALGYPADFTPTA